MSHKPETINFYDQIKSCRKLLVLDQGFLGDAIHLIPALWMIRDALSKARLDVMIADHIKSLYDLLPWVDAVIGYPRFPVAPKWYEDIPRILSLRKEKYDAVINLNGSDRTSILTYLTGANFRLGRISDRPPLFLKYCFTNTVFVPFHTTPVFRQRCECLEKTGFPKGEMKFPITIPRQVQNKMDAALKDIGHFVHVSPFTTKDLKELPAGTLADAINAMNFEFVISCAANEREKNKLDVLLNLLKRKPVRVFPGNLNIVELTALIARSCLHLGGDSGALHIAMMAGTPSIAWFRNNLRQDWIPQGETHRQLIGEASPSGLTGISANDLVHAITESGAYPP